MIKSTSARERGCGSSSTGRTNYQLDGDVVGESTTLDAEIQPGALAICMPAQAGSEPQL